MTTYEIHPLCLLMPEMSTEDYAPFRADIKRNGLRNDILLAEHEGKWKIIDGRTRYNACIDEGVKPTFQKWSGKGSLAELVLSLNQHRRHLTTSQRAAIAVEFRDEIAKETRASKDAPPENRASKDARSPKSERKSSAKAAKIMKVSPTTVERAAKIKREDPDLFSEVKEGKKTVGAAKTELDHRAESFEDGCSDEPENESPAPLSDSAGEPIPEKLRDVFENGSPAIEEVCRDIQTARRKAEDVAKGPGGKFIQARIQAIQMSLDDAKGTLRGNKPTHVCPYCKAKNKDCKYCDGAGYVPKHVYEGHPEIVKRKFEK